MKFRAIFFLVVVMTLFCTVINGQSQGQNCRTVTGSDDPMEPTFEFPWFPSMMQTLNFHVETFGSTQIELFLSTEPAVVDPIYAINIGEDVPDDAGDGADGDVDAALFRNDDGDTTAASGNLPVARSDADGYITAQQGYDMFITYNPVTGSITIGKQGEAPILSWTDPSPLKIKWIGVGSVGSARPAEFTFCEFAPERIHITLTSSTPGGSSGPAVDGNPNTCTTMGSSNSAPFLRLDLGADYVVDIIIADRVASNGGTDHLTDGTFFVGGCTGSPNTNNAQCGTAITSDENTEARMGNNERRWIARCCLETTIGRYVFIQKVLPSGTSQIKVCEMEVYGHRVTPEEEALLPTCSMQQSEWTVLEGTSTGVPIAVVTGPLNHYACPTIRFDAVDGTAIEDTDFSFNEGLVSFDSPVTNPVNNRVTGVNGDYDDTIYTGNKEFTAQLSYSRGCKIGTLSNATIIIQDNDPHFTFSAGKYTIQEDIGTFDLQIIREGYTQVATSIVLALSTDTPSTASLTGDYTTENELPLTLEFDIDETVKRETITIVNDDLAELTETINFELQLPEGDGVTGSVSETNGTTSICIEDADGAVFSLAATPESIFESSRVYTLIISRSGYMGDAGQLVYVTTSGITATEGIQAGNQADFEALSTPVTFSANQPTASVDFEIYEDSLREGDEQFQITISLLNPSLGSIEPGQNVKTIEIIDNDYPVSLSSSTYLGSEAEEEAEITVIRTENEGPLQFELQVGVSGVDTALRDRDFNSQAIRGTIPDGETSATVSIHIEDDGLVETTEHFTVRLVSVTTGIIDPLSDEAFVSIIDNDGTYSLTVDNTVAENAGSLAVVISRGGGLINRVGQVRISTVEAGAEDGVDYRGIDRIVTFAIGQVSDIVNIDIIDNPEVDTTVNRVFRVRLSDADSILDPLTSDVAITITDNDASCSLSTSEVSVAELDGVVSITVLRTGNTGGICALRVSEVSARLGEDFTGTSDLIVRFLPGETQKSVSFGINNDGRLEGDETFTVTVIESDPGMVGTPSQVTITITDEAVSDSFNFDSSVYTIRESAGTLEVTILRTGNEDTVRVTSRSPNLANAAISPDDFQAIDTFLTFTVGQSSQTVDISVVNDDDLTESSEIFELVLSNGQVATVTIVDDGDGTEEPEEPSSGLSAGEIAGLAIGALAGVLLAGLAGTIVLLRMRTLQATRSLATQNKFQLAPFNQSGYPGYTTDVSPFNGQTYSDMVNNPLFNSPEFQTSYSPYSFDGMNYGNFYQ